MKELFRLCRQIDGTRFAVIACFIALVTDSIPEAMYAAHRVLSEETQR